MDHLSFRWTICGSCNLDGPFVDRALFRWTIYRLDGPFSIVQFDPAPRHQHGVDGKAKVNVQRFRGGLVFKARRLCVSLNSRRGSNKEEEKQFDPAPRHQHGVDGQAKVLLGTSKTVN